VPTDDPAGDTPRRRAARGDRQAGALFAASLGVSPGLRERELQAMQILIGDRKLGEVTWADLFDGLTPERAGQIRDLYDALPDGARAEYDRRYGRPRNV
jgi:hypothetical protein